MGSSWLVVTSTVGDWWGSICSIIVQSSRKSFLVLQQEAKYDWPTMFKWTWKARIWLLALADGPIQLLNRPRFCI